MTQAATEAAQGAQRPTTSPAVRQILEKAAVAEKQNKFQEALNILQAGIREHRGAVELVIAIGHVHLRLKKYPEAEALYGRLADKNGKMPFPAAVGLAEAFLGQQKFEHARKVLAPLIKQAPNDLNVLLGLARCAVHRKELLDAEKLIDKAQEKHADNVRVRHERARLLLEKKEQAEAVALLEKNIDRKDPYGDSIDLWIDSLKAQKRELYIREKLQEWHKRHPHRPEFLFGLGLTYSRAGEIHTGRQALEQVNKMLGEANFRVFYELAVLERLAGNIEKSQKYLERVMELKPAHPAAIRTYGVDHKYQYGDKWFAMLNTEAANLTAMQPMDQVQMHYGLGKAFDDVGELETAFRHYAIGGMKKKKIDKFDETGSHRVFEIMKKVINRETIEKSAQEGCLDETPVFILGMPRSGTSLMEQILSSHPDIFGAGELKHMTSALENIDIAGRRIKLGDVEPAFAYDLNASFRERGQWYVDMLKSLAPKPYTRIVDKMPGNFNFLGMIHAILPKARIIHSRRHPVETCLSCYRILFAEGHQWTYNLSELGRYYRRYWDLMKHWRTEFPGVMYEVRYEDNVADVEGSARKLIDHLGLPWHEGCLEFYNTDRPVKTASASQVRKPIYSTSAGGRWKKYEKYLKPLTSEIADIIEEYEAEIAHLNVK